jgi:hypothetical protein
MFEQFYKVLPHHVIRINRTVPLDVGNDKHGKPMATSWALEAIIECLQKYYHQMIKENNGKGWLAMSHHIMTNNKGRRYIQSEFTRVGNSGQRTLNS